MAKETKTASGWVSLELWDNTLEENLKRWNHNKWALSKEHRLNVDELFFYGTIVKHENNVEIFTFTDGYIFLHLKDKTKLPPISKIHGAVDWVKSGPQGSNSTVIIFDNQKISSMKTFVKERLEKHVNGFKEGKKAKVNAGLYKGMEGVIDKKQGVFVSLKFYLNSKNFETKLPFWFLNAD
jgi:transcription antitermination factor NusG